jgi:hypothetical protein
LSGSEGGLSLSVARGGDAVKRENGGKTGNNAADRTAPLTATLSIYGESVTRMTALVSIVRMLTHAGLGLSTVSEVRNAQ